MINRIVVPLDGSTAAETALSYVQLIPSEHVRLIYVEPARTHVSPHFLSIARTKLRSSPEQVEHAYLELMGQVLRAAGRHVECRVRLGDPAAEIIAAAADADLVVLASVHLGNGRLVDSSVADRVVRHGQKPTLVIRAAGTSDTPKITRIVVPVDGSVRAESALPIAHRLADELSASLHLVRVVEPGTALELVDLGLFSPSVYASTLAAIHEEGDRQLAALHRREMGRGHRVTSELRVGAPAAELLAVIQPDDLVVMTTHGAGGTMCWRLGGVVEKLLRRAPAPLVLLHTLNGAATHTVEEIAAGTVPR